MRTTILPLCALCYGFSPCHDCGAGVAKDAVHVTEWNGKTIVRQYDANPEEGPDYLDIARRAHLIACVASENA